MWALPQCYEKATATLWKHDRYRYRYSSYPITLQLRLQNFSVTLALA